MKTTPLIVLIVSLAINAVLGWRWFVVSKLSKNDLPPTAANQANLSTAVLVPGSNAELRDRLRELGFSQEEVRTAVRFQLESRRLSRQRELLVTASRQPWWRGAATAATLAPTEQNRELRELRQTEREELLGLFGPLGLATTAELERYAYLPPEKAARLAALESDYSEQRAAASQPTSVSPSGPERVRELTEAHDLALAALLTPEEHAMVTQRESQTALNLAESFDLFSPSESEAQSIYTRQRSFDDQFKSAGAFSADAMNGRRIATEQLQQDLESVLGPGRYAEWQRAQRPEYFSLIEMQRRFSVAQPAIDVLATLPDQMAETSKRIAADSTLTEEQKQVARDSLLEQVQTQIHTTLGSDLSRIYLSEVGRWWMDPLSSKSNRAASGPIGGAPTGKP